MFWKELNKVSGLVIPSLHPCSWATDIFQTATCSQMVASWLVCGAWTLWMGRNSRRHGGKTWDPGAKARYISKLMEDLASLKVQPKPARPPREKQWQRPAAGWMKVNADASFDSISCTGSAGVVIRDQEGLVCAGAARWFDGVQDALSAEALAAKEGLELASELGYDQVILEVDSKNLKTLLEDRSSVRSSIGGLCFDIMERGRTFNDFKVVWVCREANSVAHCSACMVTSTERSLFWLDYVPEWLSELASADCNPASS